jgi:hypothetical protein
MTRNFIREPNHGSRWLRGIPLPSLLVPMCIQDVKKVATINYTVPIRRIGVEFQNNICLQ